MTKKIIVISVKGGSGKSFVSVNTAYALSEYGKVALIDADIDSPHVPMFLGATEHKVRLDKTGMRFEPARIKGIKHDILVNSMGMIIDMEGKAFLQTGQQHRQIIRDMINRTNWGKVDYWIADCPAGSGDELDIVSKLFGQTDGAIIVGLPNLPESIMRCIDLCSFRMIKIIGCIINFYGAVMHGQQIKCPHCDKPFMPYKDLGSIELCNKEGIKVLGTIPLNPEYSDTHIDTNLDAIKAIVKEVIK